MYKLDCWFKGIWRSLPQWLNGSYPISGHLFVDKEYHRGCDVIISKCEHCNQIHITWKGGRQVDTLEELYQPITPAE